MQLAPWRTGSSVANLVPFPSTDRFDESAVRRTVAAVEARGYTGALTSALSFAQAAPFIAHGFVVHEELYLLERDLRGPAVVSDRNRTRRSRRGDWDSVLALDSLAFQPFWRFDRQALVDSTKATPRHRFHVTRQEPVAGYHVTGLAGRSGYLQRVAVHPDAQREGWGRSLVEDALLWLQRNNAATAFVNTQLTNVAAVRLYEASGFTIASERLLVLRHDLGNAVTLPLV